jgi:hypothetical protein
MAYKVSVCKYPENICLLKKAPFTGGFSNKMKIGS